MSYPEKTSIAIIGYNAFTKEVLIPELKKLGNAELSYIFCKNEKEGQTATEETGIELFQGSIEKLLADKNVEVVAITENFKNHAELVLKALEAGKHVMVEAPLALNIKELKAIEFFFAKNDSESKDSPLLLVLNERRFSPLLKRISSCLSKKIGPAIISYNLNASYIDHKSNKRINGGGRNLTEAVKIYDIFSALLPFSVKDIKVSTLSNSPEKTDNTDNFITTFSFTDGSIASLVFSTIGNCKHPTDEMTIFCDENVFLIKDFLSVGCKGTLEFKEEVSEKNYGFAEMIREFIGSVRNPSAPSPTPIKEQLEVARIAIAVEARLNNPIMPLTDLLDISDKTLKSELSLKEKAIDKFKKLTGQI